MTTAVYNISHITLFRETDYKSSLWAVNVLVRHGYPNTAINKIAAFSATQLKLKAVRQQDPNTWGPTECGREDSDCDITMCAGLLPWTSLQMLFNKALKPLDIFCLISVFPMFINAVIQSQTGWTDDWMMNDNWPSRFPSCSRIVICFDFDDALCFAPSF